MNATRKSVIHGQEIARNPNGTPPDKVAKAGNSTDGEQTRKDDSLRLEALARNTRVSGDLRVEKLTYIHEMLGELRKLSTSIEEPMVAYLIEMALLEADTALHVRQFGVALDGGGRCSE